MQANEATRIFESYRRMLQGLAYRMLGSVSEAEDIVQETFLRWSTANHEGVRSPRAWLVTTCSRLTIDELRSARVRRESYIGPWLPEPWIAEDDPPDAKMERDDAVSMALLLVLEQVTPAERAAFILHDVFDVSFDEVAEVLGKSASACRKLASRARQRIHAAQPKRAVSTDEHQQLTEAFFKATRSGDRDALMSLLHPDVSFHSDGGGKAQAARKVLHGSDTVSGFMISVLGKPTDAPPRLTFRPTRFNGGPGLLVYEHGRLVTAFSLDLDGDRVRSIFAIRNPDKLRGFLPSG